MKRVQLRGRMLRSLEVQARDSGMWRRLRRSENTSFSHHGPMERHMSDRQRAGRLRRNHAFTAILTLIRRIAGHGTAALHALLVLRRCGHAVHKLQTQEGDQRNNDESFLAHCPTSTVGGLDARVNEGIHVMAETQFESVRRSL